MVKCLECGAGIPQDKEQFHADWHADINKKFKALYDSMVGLFQIQGKMTDAI